MILQELIDELNGYRDMLGGDYIVDVDVAHDDGVHTYDLVGFTVYDDPGNKILTLEVS